MVQPIDYMSQLQAPDLGASLLRGIQTGAAVRQVRDERVAREQAQAQQEQYRADLQSAMSNPTAQNFAALALKYPEQGKSFRETYALLDKSQQDAEFGTGVQVYHALQNGNAPAALQVLDQQIAALDNAGQDSADLVGIRSQIERDPNQALGFVGLTLSSIDPDRWGKIAGEQRESAMAPAQLTEAQAKAHSAAVAAKFAESNAAQELTKKGWEISKLQNDIDVQNLNKRIAVIDAAYKKEENDAKREENRLKREDAVAKRDEAIRSKVATVEQSRGTIDNSLSTIDRVLKNPALDSVVGSVEGSEYYPGTLVGLLPGTDSADERANALADIDTLKSQTFLNQLQQMKNTSANGASGLGALTEKEGERLINGVQSLRTKQGEKQFKDNLQEVQRLLLKARGNLAERYGVPDVIPDRPNLESQPASSGFRVLGVE